MNKEKLVLLHGWGFNQYIWDPILPELNQHFEVFPLNLNWDAHSHTQHRHPGNGEEIIRDPFSRDLCDWLAINTPEKAIYLGWSLGGLIAMAMAARYPERVSKLISVCASPSFLQSKNWPGIEAHQLDLFAEQFRADPRNWPHKFIQSQLGSLEISNINLARFLESSPPSRESLDAGLQILKNADCRAELNHLQQDKLFIFGRLDRITSEKTSAALQAQQIPKLTCETIKRAAHIPFLSHPDIFLKLIQDFCEHSDSSRKMRIKKSFNEAATTYHEAAKLQGACAEKLLEKLPADFQPQHILELGSGTGLLTRRLLEKFPNAQITAIDIAEKMLEKTLAFSKAGDDGGVKSCPGDKNIEAASGVRQLQLLCADAESLPFSDKSFDLIISNFTLQWCELSATFQECERVLKNNGHFYFCTLGENTLIELKTAWSHIDEKSHVNEFTSSQEILKLLQKQPFQHSSLTEIETQEFHEHPVKIITQIKAWGAQNIHPSRAKGLCGKNKFKQFIEFYQTQFQQDQGVYASYHTVYGSAQKN